MSIYIQNVDVNYPRKSNTNLHQHPHSLQKETNRCVIPGWIQRDSKLFKCHNEVL